MIYYTTQFYLIVHRCWCFWFEIIRKCDVCASSLLIKLQDPLASEEEDRSSGWSSALVHACAPINCHLVPSVRQVQYPVEDGRCSMTHNLHSSLFNFTISLATIVRYGIYTTSLVTASTSASTTHHRPLVQWSAICTILSQWFNDQTSTKHRQCNCNTTTSATNNTQHRRTTQQPRILHDIIQCGSYLALLTVASHLWIRVSGYDVISYPRGLKPRFGGSQGER